METKKKRDWGLIVAGILLIICAFIFALAPGMTLVTLTIFAGAAFLVAGIFNIINYVRFHKTGEATGWTLVYGILDIILGIFLFFWPLAFAAVIPWVIGIFVLIFGIYEIVASFSLKKTIGGMWGWVLFSGIVSVLVALCFIFFPFSFAIMFAVIILMRGISLIMFGVNPSRRIPS